MRRCDLGILAGAILLSACGSASDAAVPQTTERRGVQYVVGIDISGSRTPAQLAQGKALLAGIINQMTYGDRLVLLQTFQAGTDSIGQWNDTIPQRRRADVETSRDKQRLDEFRQTANMVMPMFFTAKPSEPIMTTDLLATIARASDLAKASPERQTILLLLSDMLNATPELNMERRGGIPNATWVEERRKQGRLPNLGNVCVVVSGADVTSQTGAQAREFWKGYFSAAGAVLPEQNYRNLVTSASELTCS
jgi:hypothetical protein